MLRVSFFRPWMLPICNLMPWLAMRAREFLLKLLLVAWLIWMSLTFLPAIASMSSKLGRNDTITASVLMLGMSSGLETIVAFMRT